MNLKERQNHQDFEKSGGLHIKNEEFSQVEKQFSDSSLLIFLSLSQMITKGFLIVLKIVCAAAFLAQRDISRFAVLNMKGAVLAPAAKGLRYRCRAVPLGVVPGVGDSSQGHGRGAQASVLDQRVIGA